MTKLAECLCNDPIVDFVGETFTSALPAIGQVTCSVWKLATEDAAKLLAGSVNPASEAASTSQILFKIAKMLAKEGKSASEYEEYVRKHLAAGDSCDMDFGQMFKDATGISDDALSNVGTNGL